MRRSTPTCSTRYDSVRQQKVARRPAPFKRGGGAFQATDFRDGAPGALGALYSPGCRVSKKLSTSAVFTTSAYFAFMSQRLIAWLDCERSKHPSSARATR